jgi:hypothetical protein
MGDTPRWGFLRKTGFSFKEGFTPKKDFLSKKGISPPGAWQRVLEMSGAIPKP